MSDSLQCSSWRREPISRSMLVPVELRHRHEDVLAPWKATHGCRFHAKTYISGRNPTGELAAISIMSCEIVSCWLYCCWWNWFLNGTVETQLVIITEYQDKICIQTLDGSRWMFSINNGVLPLYDSTKKNKKLCHLLANPDQHQCLKFTA